MSPPGDVALDCSCVTFRRDCALPVDFSMRSLACVMIAVAGALSSAAPGYSADAPAIVIPGKAGVPVIINGYDASYTVVEGDWGLDRPGHVPATIVSGPLVVPQRYYPSGYFPAFGYQPGYGRFEREPPANRRLPPPAQNFQRFWGTASDSLPATIETPASAVSVDVDVNAERRDRRRHGRNDQRRRQDQHRN